jgi:putative transposase
MGNEKFQNQYRIPSARARWHAYDGGAYYLTVCTAHREHYFGEIADGEMHLSVIGQFVANNLQNVSTHYQYAEIPLFVVMPNHLHAIVLIDCKKTPNPRRNAAQSCRDVARRVSTIPMENDFTGKNAKMQEIANQSGWLSVCTGGIKSAVTKYARENNIDFEWQSRFHDHIVRDTNEMNRIADYIENNVAQWESDCFYNNT